MNIPPVKREWNINTIISVLGFALTLVTLGVAYGQLTQQAVETAKSLDDYRATTDLRLSKLETETRQIDNLAFRITAAESSNATVSRALDELQATVSQQSGDLRVIREILQRIERQGQTSAMRYPASVEAMAE